ncbi:GNAT family N-acetyltransferase [Kerstersia gyiorum]|uniref:GNAT family N-acetyltransferase n=1 Tax=Kerstersia gyiorum TaxID=206506 RepID=UPI003B4381EB
MSAAQTGLTVRPATQDDYEQWLAYWNGYQTFYGVQLGLEVTRTTWNRFFDPDEPVYCAVAAQGGRIHGFVNFLYHRSTWGQNDYCYLEDLYVDPNARGRQIGKVLIEYVQAQARARQCERLYWHTQETNRTAQRLYDWVADKPGIIEYRMALANAV